MALLSPPEWAILRLSLQVAGTGVLGVAVPGIALGVLLARWRSRWRLLVELVVFLPLVLPPVVTGYVLLRACAPAGWLGRHLAAVGWPLAFDWKGAAVAAGVIGMPLLVRAVQLAVGAIDRRLEDAARTLGASPLRVLATVTLPLAWPGIVAGAALALARALGEYGATITIAGDIPGVSRILPVAIEDALATPGGDATAARLALCSIVLALAALAAAWWCERRFTRDAP